MSRFVFFSRPKILEDAVRQFRYSADQGQTSRDPMTSQPNRRVLDAIFFCLVFLLLASSSFSARARIMAKAVRSSETISVQLIGLLVF